MPVISDSHAANTPLRPLREKLAENPVLYGVLSLLKRIYGAVSVLHCNDDDCDINGS